MEMIIIGMIAIICHLVAGYHWMMKPTFRLLKIRLQSNAESEPPIHAQDKNGSTILAHSWLRTLVFF